MTKKLSNSDAIRQLKKLAITWPAGISLFSASGTLLVIQTRTGKILSEIDIPNDGGCPIIEIEGNNEYIKWE